jgi:hypothetical protein
MIYLSLGVLPFRLEIFISFVERWEGFVKAEE